MGVLVDMAEAGGGFLTTSEVSAAGIARHQLSAAVASGDLLWVTRGLYVLPQVWEDDYVIAQHRFARGVFSHGSALLLRGLSDRTPDKLTMTFPRGYNTTKVLSAGIIAKTISSDLMDLGLGVAVTPFGNQVSTYDAERTLCDMVRGQAVYDVELVNPAMRSYLTSSERDIGKLLKYAAQLRVEPKIRNFIEVLL